MALARLVFKNLQQRASSSQTPFYISKNALLGPYSNHSGLSSGAAREQGCRYALLQRFSSSSSSQGSEGKEVAVQADEGGRKGGRWRSLLPRRLRRRPIGLWRRRDTPPDPFDILPTALLEAAENMSRVMESIVPSQMLVSPTQLMGRFKESDDSYKVRFEVPGLNKDELKVAVEDGMLRIRGEKKVEEGDEDEDEQWVSYGYYNTTLALPDDANQDDIKAELKDGMLTITIPKTHHQGKNAKEIVIH